MFSIVIPLYNKGVFIKRAIDSILSQTCENYEVIVVDDGSTDGCGDYVLAYNDTRIKYYCKPNRGVSSARNFGITKAAGEWLLFLDADDLLLPNALETFQNVIEKINQTRIVVGQSIWERSGQIMYMSLDETNSYSKNIVCSNNPLFSLWLHKFYSAPRNTVIHKSLLKEKGMFDDRMSFFEDYEFALRLLEKEHIAYTTVPVAVYYQDGTGLSASSHPIEIEMAYYIPEYVETASFWHKALLYENLEMEILWWQQHGNEEYVRFYRAMQNKYFGSIYKALHWVRQKMIRLGII